MTKIAAHTRNDILWSAFIQYAGKVVQIGLGIIAIKLVTKALGLDEYGIYGKITEFAMFFSVVANLGIFGNTVRKMSEKPQDGKLFVNALVLRIVTALFFFLAGGLYAYFFIPEKAFALGVLFFMSSLFFDYITSVCDGMLQANYLMGRATIALTLGRITNLLLVLLLSNLTGTSQMPTSAALFFLAPLAAAFVTMTLSLIFVRLRIRFVWRLDRKLLRMLFLTALPFGLINIVNNLYFRFLPSFFATKALTDAQFGSYNISLHIALTVSLLSTYLMFSALPAFKRHLRDKHFTAAKNLYRLLLKGLAALALATVIFGTWLTPFAIGLVSDKDFFIPELWFLLPALLILASISYFYDLVLITLFALEKDIWFLKRELLVLIPAAAILASSLLPADPITKIALVLIGAIFGESLIVGLGLRKIRNTLS